MAKDPTHRPLQWFASSETQSVFVSTKEHHGLRSDDCSLAITSTATNPVWVRSEKHIASPGIVYTARAWVKTADGIPASLHLEFWDQNDVRIGMASAQPQSSSGWQAMEASLAAPDHVTHVTVAIGSTNSIAGNSYWDDISLAPKTKYDRHVKTGVRELFLDDYRLSALDKVQRVVHPGEKTLPLISPTERWEGRAVYIYGTVLRDEPPGSGYRMWYTTYHGGYFLCYATSEDGLHWQKPRLGIEEFQGSSQNNITHRGGGTLIYDPDDANPNRRYKLMDYVAKPAGKQGYSVYFSSDGLHWMAYEKNPVISYGDVCNVAYDRQKHLFIATTKQRMLAANTSVTLGKQDRCAFVSVSTNFTGWSAPGAPQSDWALGVEGDAMDDLRVMSQGGLEAQIYGMPVYPYEGVYIGLPWVFDVMNYTTGIYASAGDGPIQPELAVSRDLRLWSRPAREPVLPLGRQGAWDCGTLYTANTLLVSSNIMELYFGAMNLGHGGDTKTQVQTARIAKATWRRDGFVSLSNAGDDPGVITTKTIEFHDASQLWVNAKIAEGGSLQAEILDETGDPLPGLGRSESIAITGDQLAVPLQWNGIKNFGQLSGKPIRLRFLLRGGDIYSYWFN